MAAEFVASAARTSPALWALVLRFNARPAADFHPGHLAGHLDANLFERLGMSRRAEPHLSDWIIRRFELDPRGHWDFTEPRLRFALLSAMQLDRLARLLGVAALHKHIAKVLLGPQIRKLRESLGDADHQFALKRAAFLVRTLPAELEPASLADDVEAQAEEIGWRAVRACLAGAPPAVMRRLALKLPPPADIRRPASLPAAALPQVVRLAQRIVSFEVAPELAPCFN